MPDIHVTPTEGGHWQAAATTPEGRGLGAGGQNQATPLAAIGSLIQCRPDLFGVLAIHMAGKDKPATANAA